MKAENIFEATYRIEILKGLAIQPDFQYTTIPGMNGATPNSLLSQLRVEVSL
jgi:carbohydrate-selective porin OprB